MQLTRNFHEDEFKCRCGCGFTFIESSFITPLQNARDIADIPFVIKSGCRCKAHNKAVGGKEDSAHLRMAADIRTATSAERFKIVQALLAVGFTRIGMHEGFVHVDNNRSKPSGVIWLYE